MYCESLAVSQLTLMTAQCLGCRDAAWYMYLGCTLDMYLRCSNVYLLCVARVITWGREVLAPDIRRSMRIVLYRACINRVFTCIAAWVVNVSFFVQNALICYIRYFPILASNTFKYIHMVDTWRWHTVLGWPARFMYRGIYHVWYWCISAIVYGVLGRGIRNSVSPS